VASALRGFLEGAYEVRAARSEDETLEAVSSFGAELVVASESDRFDAEGVCAALKARDPSFPVVLVYAPEEKDPDGRAMRAGAEACLQGPLKQGAVLSCVRNVLALAELRARTAEAAAAAAKAPTPATAPAPAAGPTEVPDLASFKALLTREVKRSRRYKYPVAFVVVAYDAFAAGMPALETTDIEALLARARQALVGCLREQDLVSSFHPGSWVAFLPHTPAEGAMVVAERMRERLSGLDRTYLTASAGLAVYAASEGRELSFGALFREATDALAQARGEGGGRTVVGSSAAAAQRKRSRITLA
jgi:PleD family two-component response regulator